VKHFHSVSDLGQQFQLSEPVKAKLQAYAELLIKWQHKINLIGPDTLPDLWHRHMADSAQLFELIPPGSGRVADLGSGAGFPGLVLAIMGAPDVHLIESDSRKAAFLNEAVRITECAATVHPVRAEQVSPLGADVTVSRALAPLVRLIPLALPHLVGSGICVFPKGKACEDELTAAGKEWIMAVRRVPSLTDPNASILVLSEVKRA